MRSSACSGESLHRTLIISAFTRVFDALWVGTGSPVRTCATPELQGAHMPPGSRVIDFLWRLADNCGKLSDEIAENQEETS